MNGYEEAAKIDEEIFELLDKFPPTEENARQWLNFIRMFESTLEILKTHCEKLALQEVQSRLLAHTAMKKTT